MTAWRSCARAKHRVPRTGTVLLLIGRKKHIAICTEQAAQVRRSLPRYGAHLPARRGQLQPGGMVRWPVRAIAEILCEGRFDSFRDRVRMSREAAQRRAN